MTMQIEKEDLGAGGFVYVTDPDWTIDLDDGIDRQFGVLFEVLDMYMATGEPEHEDYPFLVEASLVAHEASPEFDMHDEGFDDFWLRHAAYHYAGGVPITHLLERQSWEGARKSGRVKKTATGLRGIPQDKYEIYTIEAGFGTVAAQWGSGAEYKTVRFADDAAAFQYVENLIPLVPHIAHQVGFVLDLPVNLAGNRGWETIETHVYGPDYRANNPQQPGRGNNPAPNHKPNTQKLKSRLLR